MAPLEHADGLLTYAMALTRNSFEAEDLVQETYLRAMEAMGRLREHSNDVNKVEKQQVRVALHQLSEEYREIIVLREYADLSYQQIATMLNCPLGTVMSRLARARSKLGTLLSATQTPSTRQAELPEEIIDPWS